jgi:hypothetical protein
LNKLNRAVDRFAYNHPNFGFSNLMGVILSGQLLIFLLSVFLPNTTALNFLTFDLAHLLQGEVWRLVTWVLMPTTFRPIYFLISLLCYYSIGMTLERSWGTAKFNLYYFSGMAVSVLAVSLASLLAGNLAWSLTSPYFLHMTLFMALATLYPEAVFTILLIVIPVQVKAKWLAIFYAVLFGADLISAIFAMNLPGIVLPVVSVLNFLVFFWPDFMHLLGVQTQRVRHQTSAKTINFKTAAYKQQKKEAAQGYRHKCTVCGRTDADFPDLEFRYCSRCAGYHCYCSDHIFDHQHFTE